MRFLPVCFLMIIGVNAQPVLQLVPGVLTDCSASTLVGREQVVWNYSGSGPVQVRIGGPNGVPMTSFSAPQGSADTGNWVSDGLVFVLVDANSNELARVTAAVRCSPFPDPSIAGLAASTYFPLQVGNEWVYRLDSRIGTADHQTRRVTGTKLVGDQVWYVVAFDANQVLYRADEQGRIYYMTSDGKQTLLIDPTDKPDPAAQYKVLNHGQPIRTALGNFPDSLGYSFFNVLTNETGTYARGIGLISNRVDMLTGSSGGFVSGLTLLYARIGGNLRFATPAVSLGLSTESTDLNVSGHGVTNCAVPCYFVACGLTPGADPPGTYKPCFEARVRLENLPLDSTSVDLSLLDASNRTIAGVSVSVPTGQNQPDSILIQQVPLYTAPNQPIIPGIYRLQAKAKLSDGSDLASAIISIRVE